MEPRSALSKPPNRLAGEPSAVGEPGGDNPLVTYESILEGVPPDRLFWLPRLEVPRATSATRQNTPEATAPNSRTAPLRPFASRQDPWLRTDYRNLVFCHTREGDEDLFRWETPDGTLTARRVSNHMTEYPLKTVNDIPVWRYVRDNTMYAENPNFTEADRRACRKMSFKWSPVQELLQFETGVENFYYFMADARDEMMSLMETMHRKNLEALEIGFRACSDATVIQFNENTSASLISPAFYREHTVPHVRAYADLAHQHGKRFIAHMCGLLNALLDCFPETGMDGIHAVTPPPIGDTHYMTVRERYGDPFVIIGRLNAQLWMGKHTEEILARLKKTIPPSLVKTPFALWITSDEMSPTPRDIANLNAALEGYDM